MPRQFSLLGLLLPLADPPPAGPPALESVVHELYIDPIDRPRLHVLAGGDRIDGLDAHSHFIDAHDREEIARYGHKPVFAAVLAEGALYLRLPSFHAGTALAVHEALAERLRGAPVRYLVLDLRDNRGGSVSAAVEVADEFIDDGVLASTRGRADIANMLFLAKPGGLLPSAEVVVLVDQMTASAAELLAGILAHRRGALLVGRDTYGKSSVQSQVHLEGERDAMLTIAHYYFDDGSSVGLSGLSPDVQLPPARLRGQRPPQAPADLPRLLRGDSLILDALNRLIRRGPAAAVQTRPNA